MTARAPLEESTCHAAFAGAVAGGAQLLLHLQGRAPRTLSLGGSIQAAQGSVQGLLSAINNDLSSTISTLKGDEVGDNLFQLRKNRPNLDQRVWPYVDRLVDFGEVVRVLILTPPRTEANFNALVAKANLAGAAVDAALKKLMSDPQVVEEVGL